MSGEESPKQPTFLNELYWFLVTALVGWILAAMILPPRIINLAQMFRQERRVLNDIRLLQKDENFLEGAVSAMENDQFYREGVFRSRLRVKKENEVYLESPLLPSDK